MANRFVFADEAGDFTFKRQKGASRYFMLCTFTTDDCGLSHDLLAMRREMVLNGDPDRDKLHATTDEQSLRDRVFQSLARHDFTVDATLLEKSKAQPHTRKDEPTFYQYAWFYHFKYVRSDTISDVEKVLITAAALGSKKTKASFKNAVNNSVQQLLPRDRWEVSFIDSAKDPLLWAADYCAWAIQRKWELGDTRSYDLIKSKVRSEYDLWSRGTTRYY